MFFVFSKNPNTGPIWLNSSNFAMTYFVYKNQLSGSRWGCLQKVEFELFGQIWQVPTIESSSLFLDYLGNEARTFKAQRTLHDT